MAIPIELCPINQQSAIVCELNEGVKEKKIKKEKKNSQIQRKRFGNS